MLYCSSSTRHGAVEVFTRVVTSALNCLWAHSGFFMNQNWVGHVSTMGEMVNACKALIGKPEKRRRCGRPRR